VQVKDHVLLPFATEIAAVDEEYRQLITTQLIQNIVALVPDEWLEDPSFTESPEERRAVYAQFLESRVSHSENFVNEAQNARKLLI
jgi:hypothetical protein